MQSIDNLNSVFLQENKRLETLELCKKQMASELQNVQNDAISCTLRAISLAEQIQWNTNLTGLDSLRDIIAAGKEYRSYIYAINDLQQALISAGVENAHEITSAIDNVAVAQERYNTQKDEYYSKYDIALDSEKAILDEIMTSIEDSISKVRENKASLVAQVKTVISASLPTVLRASDQIRSWKSLPNEILVGRASVKGATLPILQAAGISNASQEITLDLRHQGNLLIASSFERLDDQRIDDFIVAYIFRFLESFPLGAVNVHIFDQNTNYLYKRLNNCFQSEKDGDLTKRTIQIHTSLSDLSEIRDVRCEDIFKKTSASKPDLYAIYEADRSDPFNLVILRDGLVDGSGYASAEHLDTINALTKVDGIGHACGVRFVIVDNSVSFEKQLTSSNKHLLNSIQQNCGLRILYDAHGFSYGGLTTDLLRIEGNLDAFIQDRARFVASLINKRERSVISLDEVSANETDNRPGNILYIPVGKSGGSIVELPLSCKDEGGTVAGQCIGYIAIGQSGSGKSSFFHSLVLNGCMKYSPKDLQFWLLDFKNGGASSKYSNCGIPHIKIIAENNKIDDALCLFQMVLEEMERRSKAFNRAFTDNIIEYNKKAENEGLKYFPRIIIAIDEVQEIFREDNASVLQKLISSISTRMRSAGMHFVMVAQNLSEGKSYMLKEAFMPSATGRICFRVSQDIPRDSGFEDAFIQRKKEISELKAGEAFVSYGKDTIKKVRMAYVSPQDMNDTVFSAIRAKYSEFSYLKPRVIGSKARLSLLSSRQGVQGTYQDVLATVKSQNGMYNAVLGEDVYRMSPFLIHFSQYENSSVLFLGSDKQMASSLCTSVAVSLLKQNVLVHLFNGDRAKITDGFETLPHPFTFFCQSVGANHPMMQIHRLNQLKDVLRDMYTDYLNRQAEVQKAEDEEPSFPAVVLIVNDLFGIESFISNDIIESEDSKESALGAQTPGLNFKYDIFDQGSTPSQKAGQFREGAQNILSTLLKNGYRYNIHVVLAIKGDPATWRTGRTITGINNIMLFNDTEYADQVENSYFLREMLKNISNDGDEETVAVWAGRKSFSKIRPIIYKMSNQRERDSLNQLIYN